MWPDKHMLRKRVQQPTMKQELRYVSQQQQHEEQHLNNISCGNQPLQVLNYQLKELKQTNRNLSTGI